MKKWKFIAAAAAVVIGATAIFFGWTMFRFSTLTKTMCPLPTGEVVPGIYAVKDDFANMFLVKTANGYIAFDAGNDEKAVARGLEELSIDPSSVKALFLSHCDSDHTAAAGLFKDAVVYVPEMEKQMIDGTTARALIFKNKLDRKYSLMKDGETLTVGGVTVKAILTPGHTPGSTSFLVNGADLFIGDALALKEGRVCVLDDFVNMDPTTVRRSMDRITSLPGVKRLFTAHYGYSDDFRSACERWNSRKRL
ncbi:MAG: MBL fold metallo-hydrolase [Spirochaetes bacterium]|nr:MBL fold metallo-hydrolase [Spirochaetota bacterium]